MRTTTIIWYNFKEKKPIANEPLLTVHSDGSIKASMYEIEPTWKNIFTKSKSFSFRNMMSKFAYNNDVVEYCYINDML